MSHFRGAKNFAKVWSHLFILRRPDFLVSCKCQTFVAASHPSLVHRRRHFCFASKTSSIIAINPRHHPFLLLTEESYLCRSHPLKTHSSTMKLVLFSLQLAAAWAFSAQSSFAWRSHGSRYVPRCCRLLLSTCSFIYFAQYSLMLFLHSELPWHRRVPRVVRFA